MRKSTLARFILLGFGLNFTGIWFGVILHTSFITIFHAVICMFLWRWIETNYFDVEDNTNDESDDNNSQ